MTNSKLKIENGQLKMNENILEADSIIEDLVEILKLLTTIIKTTKKNNEK